MKRSIVFHESQTRADNWLLWLLVVLGAIALALALVTKVAAATAYYSFTGTFTDGTETQGFLFDIDRGLPRTAPFSLRTWHYNGVSAPPGNAAGEPIAAGGFDPQLWLYDATPGLVVYNDDGPTGLDSLINWATPGMPESLAGGAYRLDLVTFDDTLGGRYGYWAVDLVSDAAKFTLTGVDNTGVTTITSLKMGSDDARVPAKLQLGPAENLSISETLLVGNTGAAEITVTTGSLSSHYGAIGNYPDSTGSVTLKQGGSWTTTCGVCATLIGFNGDGNLRVESGSPAQFAGALLLGYAPGSVGNATVTGFNSIITVNKDLWIGGEGVDNLRIEDRGKLNSAGVGDVGDTVGWRTGSSGAVDVDGFDSLWQTDKLTVGGEGQGIVRVTNGGTIDTTGNAYIGKTSNAASSSVTVAGMSPELTKATWLVSGDLYIAGDEAGPSSAAFSTVAVNPGGLVDVAGTTTVWNNGGNLKLLGGELETGSLFVKPGGTFTHHDGTLTVDGGTFDPGVVGYRLNGATPTDLPVVKLINGASASLRSTSADVGVGVAKRGRLEILSGSHVDLPDSTSSLAIGHEASSDGEVVVRGKDSALTTDWGLFVGHLGRGVLRILGGGSVYDPASPYEPIASNSGSEGIVEVSGTDLNGTPSTYTTHGQLQVGLGGHGTLIVSGGGHLNALAGAAIAMYPGSDGSSTAVMDPDSHWAITGPLYVGGRDTSAGGSGRLTVANNGLVNASNITVWQPGTVELDGGIISTGSLELAGGTLRGNGSVIVSGQLTNSGVVAPGLSAGVINVSGGNYVQNANGTLEIEIGGTASSQFDQLNVAHGSATLSGTLDVSLVDLGSGVFAPRAYDWFPIVNTALGVNGLGFDSYNLPALDGGLFWLVGGTGSLSLWLQVLSTSLFGDYNHNGIVDAADYVAWRKTFRGPNVPPPSLDADGDSDSDVDDGDYNVWRSHFGMTVPLVVVGNLPGRANGAIPEPATLVLLALACCVTLLWQVRGRRRELPLGRCCQLMVLSALVFCSSIHAAPAGVIYSAAADFSSTNNPDGAWSYGWSASLTSEFHLYPTAGAGSGLNSWYDPPITVLGAPAVVHNPTANTITSGTVSILAGQLAFHPGNLGQFSVVRWSAPTDGSILIAATFTGRDLWGTTTDVHVLHNGTSLFDGIVNGFATGPPPFETTRTVLAGDTVDFSVGYRNGSFWNDTTSLDGVIEIWPAALLAGDYNQNGVVDAADYVVWRTNLDTNIALPNDPIGGTIGPTHYDQWRAHFGQIAGSGALAAVRHSQPNLDRAIPEPASLALLLIGGALLAAPMRRAGSRVTHRRET